MTLIHCSEYFILSFFCFWVFDSFFINKIFLSFSRSLFVQINLFIFSLQRKSEEAGKDVFKDSKIRFIGSHETYQKLTISPATVQLLEVQLDKISKKFEFVGKMPLERSVNQFEDKKRFLIKTAY